MEAPARARKTEWQRQQRRAFRDACGYSTTANYGAGGQRAAVLARDGAACVQCGLSDAQHKARWNRPITIDHINKDRSDNRMENLQTLCLQCHGRKDLLPSLRVCIGARHEYAMRDMRGAGHTYAEIAACVGLSIGTVWNYLNRKPS